MNKSGYQYRGKTKPETRWFPLTIRLHVVKYERHNLEVFQTYPINSDNAKKFIFFSNNYSDLPVYASFTKFTGPAK